MMCNSVRAVFVGVLFTEIKEKEIEKSKRQCGNYGKQNAAQHGKKKVPKHMRD